MSGNSRLDARLEIRYLGISAGFPEGFEAQTPEGQMTDHRSESAEVALKNQPHSITGSNNGL
jgi:hypothetical protein